MSTALEDAVRATLLARELEKTGNEDSDEYKHQVERLKEASENITVDE